MYTICVPTRILTVFIHILNGLPLVSLILKCQLCAHCSRRRLCILSDSAPENVCSFFRIPSDILCRGVQWQAAHREVTSSISLLLLLLFLYLKLRGAEVCGKPSSPSRRDVRRRSRLFFSPPAALIREVLLLLNPPLSIPSLPLQPSQRAWSR